MDARAELVKIAQRIAARATLDRRDRARQRELIRNAIHAGKSWDEVQEAAGVSRPTIAAALKRND